MILFVVFALEAVGLTQVKDIYAHQIGINLENICHIHFSWVMQLHGVEKKLGMKLY
jgi:hypothetical protein